MQSSHAAAALTKNIDLMSGATLPLPLSSDKEGALWRCGDFIVTWQENAKSVQERVAELLGKPYTPTVRFPYVLMGFPVSKGPELMPSIILSVSIPLDQEADEPVAVVSFTLADKEVVLGELHDVSRIPVEQMQQLLMNTFGDLVEVREGEVIEYLGPLSDFKNESHWK